MWTNLFWKEEGIWIANVDKTLTPLYPFSSRGHYDKLENLINNFNNIQNKFTLDFVNKYKDKDFKEYLTIGSYWVNTYRDERTIYYIEDIKDNKVYKHKTLTDESASVSINKFLNCHLPLGLELDYDTITLRYISPYFDDNLNIFAKNYDSIHNYIDSEDVDMSEINNSAGGIGTITINTENKGDIMISENPVSLTEPNNYYMNETAIITTKIFNTSLFELGKAYRLRYFDGKEYSENYEAILVNISEKELVFTSYNIKDKTLQPIAVGVEYMRENENGEGWDVWKMNG